MEKYNFTIPVKIEYVADESNTSIESLEDIELIENKYDIDLHHIIDEYEYKIDDVSIVDDDDYHSVSTDDIFNEIINNYWDEIIKLINREYKLNELSNETIKIIFNCIKNEFDTSKFILDSVIDFNNTEIYKINTIKMVNYDKITNNINIEIFFDKELSTNQLNDMENWLEIQTNDRWGDYMSNNDLSDKINEDNFNVYFNSTN